MADDPAIPLTEHTFGQIAARMGNMNEWCDLCGKAFFEIAWEVTALHGEDYMKSRSEAEAHDLLKEVHACFRGADVPTAKGREDRKASAHSQESAGHVKAEDGGTKDDRAKDGAGSVGGS